MKLDILVIAVHPDDAELCCSGTLIRHIQEGKKVGIVDLTRGEINDTHFFTFLNVLLRNIDQTHSGR